MKSETETKPVQGKFEEKEDEAMKQNTQFLRIGKKMARPNNAKTCNGATYIIAT